MTVSLDAAENLTSQFANADITKAFLSALLSPFDEIDEGIRYLVDNTNLGFGASGVWLDNEGNIVGVKRLLGETPADEIFHFVAAPGATGPRGFGGGKLRSVYGNFIPGTEMTDDDFTRYAQAKANTTFRGTSLRDIVDFVFEVFGVECRADFVSNSDVYVTLGSILPYSSRRIIEQYAPVSAGSILTVL